MAKTLWHGELTKLGPATVTVASEVKKSQFPGKPNYVYLKVLDKTSGQFAPERPYNVENPSCEAFFADQKGRTFIIVAEGKAETATITYVGEAAAGMTPAPAPAAKPATPPPRPPVAAAPPAPPSAPASYVPPMNNPPPPPPHGSMSREQALRATKAFVGQRLSLLKICVKAVSTLQPEYKALMKVDMAEETFRAWVTSLYISSEAQGLSIRSGFADAMPPHIELATLAPPAKAAAPGASLVSPPAAQPPLVECPKCRQMVPALMQSGMCQACDEKNDDVPF